MRLRSPEVYEPEEEFIVMPFEINNAPRKRDESTIYIFANTYTRYSISISSLIEFMILFQWKLSFS